MYVCRNGTNTYPFWRGRGFRVSFDDPSTQTRSTVPQPLACAKKDRSVVYEDSHALTTSADISPHEAHILCPSYHRIRMRTADTLLSLLHGMFLKQQLRHTCGIASSEGMPLPNPIAASKESIYPSGNTQRVKHKDSSVFILVIKPYET